MRLTTLQTSVHYLAVASLALLPSVRQSWADDKQDFIRWEKDIAAFEMKDKENPPPKNAVLFAGSSSIRLWDLKESFPDLEAINRGFGGSQIGDSTHFAPRIILKTEPRIIVLYAGDNDLAAGKTPEQVSEDFQAFAQLIHKELPTTKIIFIAIKPSPARWQLADKQKNANDLIEAYCKKHDGLAYLDMVKPMLGEDGKPRKELFVKDGLHLNEKGYELWASLLKSFLAGERKETLWEAARTGDSKKVEALLDDGGDVNGRTHYGATALWFAADKGHIDVVKVLLKRKADPNVADNVWGVTPLNAAAGNEHIEVVKLLLAAGAEGADSAFLEAVQRDKTELAKAFLDSGKIKSDTLDVALFFTPEDKGAVVEFLKKAGAKPVEKTDPGVDESALAKYADLYESPGGARFRVELRKGLLTALSEYGQHFLLRPVSKTTFKPAAYENVTVTFEGQGEKITKIQVKRGPLEAVFERVDEGGRRDPKLTEVDDKAVKVDKPSNWPSFRGPFASGIADGQHPPIRWDAEKGTNILWKTPIDGLAHSSPIVWEDRVFVTTAVSSDLESEFKPGLYGAGTSAKDVTKHSWRVYCLDKQTGKILWEKTAHEGVPKVKRHIKSSHANATPATDGKHLVVSFASEGLYCYDLDGNLLWKQYLGLVDNGAFNDPDIQWGAASSPIIFERLAIVQVDRHKDSYLAAYNIDTGKQVWSQPRDEPPSWGTPTVFQGKNRVELITNGTKYVRGYDPRTGKELWRLARNSEITVPTPIAGNGLIFVTSGYRPIQPIYAIFPGATGDISLKEDNAANDSIAWSTTRGGPYMPTPILNGDYLYTCANAGIVTCLEARTGKQVYRERLGGTGGYSASPVAADGRIYFTSEESGVRVVKAGPKFEMLAVNPMGDPCMATPAISDGMIFVRSQHYLFGIARKETAKVP
jgi:outer membrane protein assembly factor BamB/lysophospholipase L1-like esterase